jgi:hypothetical protein
MIKQREGLSALLLTEEETTGKVNKGPAGPGKWCTVEYSKHYKGVTKTFMQAVMTSGKLYMHHNQSVLITIAVQTQRCYGMSCRICLGMQIRCCNSQKSLDIVKVSRTV